MYYYRSCKLRINIFIFNSLKYVISVRLYIYIYIYIYRCV